MNHRKAPPVTAGIYARYRYDRTLTSMLPDGGIHPRLSKAEATRPEDLCALLPK
jgi:hypothetical protein